MCALTYTWDVVPLLHEWRTALESGFTKTKRSFYELRARTKRALWHTKDGWSRLTAGLEMEELWAQFKTEASESSRLYKQDVSGREGAREQSWKQPFKILGTLFWSILKKLSPARRLFLLLTMILAFLAVIGFHFLFFTQELEFTAAFAGLLILLVLTLG